MTFDGFVPPVDDYFRMPNAWINICAEIDSLSELKVVQYVLRHTWGYQGFSGARKITIDEFMHGRKRKDGSRIDNGTGLSKQSVITAVGAAIEHGYLTCDRDDKDMARQKKYYQLAMKSDVKHLDITSDVKELDIQTDVQNLDISDVKELDHDVQALDSDGQEFGHRTEKDTIRKTLKKDTLERQVVDASASKPAPVTDLQSWRTDSEKRRALFADVPLSKEDEGEDISKLETIKHSATDPSQQTPGAGAAIPPSSGASAQATLPGTNSTPAQRSGASLTGIPASPGAVQASEKRRKVTQATDEPVPKSDTREIQRRINEHRGYALEEKVQIIQERQAIKSWCNLHTVEEYERVMRYLKHDSYWGKPENNCRIGGLTLAKETPKALAQSERPPTPIKGKFTIDQERNQRNIAALHARAEEKRRAANG